MSNIIQKIQEKLLSYIDALFTKLLQKSILQDYSKWKTDNLMKEISPEPRKNSYTIYPFFCIMLENLSNWLPKRQQSSLKYYALYSFLIFLIYTSILLSITFLLSFFILARNLNIGSVYRSVETGVFLGVVIGFFGWIVTFFAKFKPQFYAEDKKSTRPSPPDAEESLISYILDLISFLILTIIAHLFFFPAYYVILKFNFRATEAEIIAREERAWKKEEEEQRKFWEKHGAEITQSRKRDSYCTTCGIWQKCVEEDYEKNPKKPICCRCKVIEGILTTDAMCEDCQNLPW